MNNDNFPIYKANCLMKQTAEALTYIVQLSSSPLMRHIFIFHKSTSKEFGFGYNFEFKLDVGNAQGIN